VPPHPFDKRWFVHSGGKTYGPYTGHEIGELVDQQSIVATDFVYAEGGSAWTQAANDLILQTLFRAANRTRSPSLGGKPFSRHYLTILSAILVAAGVGWIAWPYYCVYELATALRDGDVSVLENRVAWDSVRRGLRDDLNVILVKALDTDPKIKTNESGAAFAGLAAILVPALTDRMIDSHVTAQAIATSRRDANADPVYPGAAGTTNKDFAETIQKARRVRWDWIKYAFFSGGPLTFKVEFAPEDDWPFKSPATAIFKWDGSWRLTRLLFPSDAFKRFDAKANDYAGNQQAVTPSTTRTQPVEAKNDDELIKTKKQDYLRNLQVYDFKAGYHSSVLDGRIPGVEFKIKNNGSETLEMVKAKVYFKDARGNTIAEEDYTPVFVSEFKLFDNNKPLRPNYIWQLERGKFLTAKSVPSEWKEGAAEIQITDIRFEGESKR